MRTSSPGALFAATMLLYNVLAVMGTSIVQGAGEKATLGWMLAWRSGDTKLSNSLEEEARKLDTGLSVGRQVVGLAILDMNYAAMASVHPTGALLTPLRHTVDLSWAITTSLPAFSSATVRWRFTV